jgi:hypothetical protein
MRSAGNDWSRVKGDEGSQVHRDSDLRIYCDNGKPPPHQTLKKTFPNRTDNRWKPETNGPFFVDPQNMVRAKDPACRKNPTIWNAAHSQKAVNGASYVTTVKPPDTAQQNPDRVVTTVSQATCIRVLLI